MHPASFPSRAIVPPPGSKGIISRWELKGIFNLRSVLSAGSLCCGQPFMQALSVPTTSSLLGCQVVTTCGLCSPGLDSRGSLEVKDTSALMNLWGCLVCNSSPKLHRFFSKITQVALKKKVSAFLRHLSLCLLLENCRCSVSLLRELFIIISAGKLIGAAEDNNKHLWQRRDDILLW